MGHRDTIKERIIDRAVDLFKAKNPKSQGLFTTAHYGQAMKAEFKTTGPTLDSVICTEHLSGMDDIVEKAGSHLWRKRSDANFPIDNDITEIVDDRDDNMIKSIAWAEQAVLQLLTSPPQSLSEIGGTMWWTIDTAADALIAKIGNVRDDLRIRNLVGCVLYGMAVEGLIIAKRHVVLEGECQTVFSLAPNDADLQPPFDGTTDGFGEKLF